MHTVVLNINALYISRHITFISILFNTEHRTVIQQYQLHNYLQQIYNIPCIGLQNTSALMFSMPRI